MSKPGSKYYPLHQYLAASQASDQTLSFTEIERLLGQRLPASARRQRGWWSNREHGGIQAKAWLSAGYQTVEIDLKEQVVTFRKPAFEYQIRRAGDIVLWDANMIKALRHHMGITQVELAKELGVRQQTVSEWETQMYAPKKAMSRLLGFVAEEAGFYVEEQSQV